MYRALPALFSLLSLSSAFPLEAAVQSRDSNPGCNKASFGGFAWTVTGFDYHASYVFSTPAHQNSWGYVNFNLTNPALTYPAICSASSDRIDDFFYGDAVYTCTLPDGASSTTETSFEFSRPSGLLNVTQSWVCSDADPQYPTTFNYKGSANLTLECTETMWTNPDWTIGQIYSDREVKCAPVDATVKPYQLEAVA